MIREQACPDRELELLLAKHAQQQLKLGVFALYAQNMAPQCLYPPMDSYERNWRETKRSFAHAEMPLVPSWTVGYIFDTLYIQRFNIETTELQEGSSLPVVNVYKASEGRREPVLQRGFNTEQYELLSTQVEELIESGLDLRHEEYIGRRLPNDCGDLGD